MRNMEAMERIIKAGQYQKKAIHALLPESAEGHLQVIEREWKAMLMEMVMENISPEMILNFMNTWNSHEDEDIKEPEDIHDMGNVSTKKPGNKKAEKKVNKRVKKVTID